MISRLCVCVCVFWRLEALGASPWGLNSCFKVTECRTAGGWRIRSHTRTQTHMNARTHTRTISYLRSELAVAAVVKQNVLDDFVYNVVRELLSRQPIH